MSPKRRKIAAVAGLALLSAGVLVVLAGIGDGDDGATLVASGTVEATEGRLGLEVPGRLAEIRVHEGDPVEAGDTLALLDRGEALARREAAEGELDAARARLDELTAGFRAEEVRQAEAALRAAKEQKEDARRDLERTRRLREGGAVSREALDKARTAFEVASSRYGEVRERARLMREGPREEQIRAQRSRAASARASLRALDARLANMVVTAPFDGVVTVRHREPGEVVGAGAAVVTLMNPDDRWVRIYVPEDRIGAVKLGQETSVTTDTYGDRSYRGRVRFIASEAEFTPKNVQTQEERVKLVYRVKVRITGDPELDLRPGVPADVRIDLAGRTP
jgi:HlyD family secretion protein